MIKSIRKLTRFKYAATLVDGKIVSCRGGTIVVTTAPASAGGSTKPSNLPPKVNIGNLPRAAATC